MAELRNLSAWERLKSNVLTARATPDFEARDPIRGLGNVALKQIPLPEDIISGLALASKSFFATMNVDPAARVEAGQEWWDALSGMAKGAAESPISTAVSLAGLKAPEAALNAYREATPMAARAYLHQFYGAGEPLTYMPKKVRPYATEGAQSMWDAEAGRRLNAQELRAVGAKDALRAREADLEWKGKLRKFGVPERDVKSPGVGSYFRRQASIARAQAEQILETNLRGLDMPSPRSVHEEASANVGSYLNAPKWNSQGAPAWVGTHAEAPARSFYTRGQNLFDEFKPDVVEALSSSNDYAHAVHNLTSTFGKTFVTVDKAGKATGLRDLYKFWPEAYGYTPEQLSAGGILKDVLTAGQSDLTPGGWAHPKFTSRAGKFWQFDFPRRAAIRFGTPYEINVPLPSGVGAPNAFDRGAQFVGAGALTNASRYAAPPTLAPRDPTAPTVDRIQDMHDQLKAYFFERTQSPTGF